MMDSNNLPRQSNGNAYHVVRIGTSSATPTGLGGEHGRFIPQSASPQRRLPTQLGGSFNVPYQRPAHPMTPQQARFTATSRLAPGNHGGYSQSVPVHAYGIKRPFNADYAIHDFSGIRKFPRSVDKSRGLRHFSTKVCEKVKEKGHTNYNEVADELVAEYFDSLTDPPVNSEKQQYDMKNIRRRVYDALNVLMAMNIIEKEKKEIRWVGLPTSSYAEVRRLQEEKTQRQDRLRQKTEQLQELILQLVAYKSLVQRNRDREREHGRPAENSILYLPYIIVNTEKKTMIDCQIAPDRSEYWFNFDQPFEIHDDIEVLKRLGLSYGLDRGQVAEADIPHIKGCLPPALRGYVDQIIEGTLAGGAISKSVQGPQTVVISANMQERKPKIVTHTVSGRPAVAGYGVQASPGAIHRRPAIQPTRYAVVPRPAQGMRYTPGAPQHIVYRAGPQGGRPFVLQSNTAHQSRLAPHPQQPQLHAAPHQQQQPQQMTVGSYLQQQHAQQRAAQHAQVQHGYQQPQHHEPQQHAAPQHAQHHDAYQQQHPDDEGQDYDHYEEIISEEHHY